MSRKSPRLTPGPLFLFLLLLPSSSLPLAAASLFYCVVVVNFDLTRKIAEIVLNNKFVKGQQFFYGLAVVDLSDIKFFLD